MSVSVFELIARGLINAGKQYGYEYEREQKLIKKSMRIIIFAIAIMVLIVAGIILFSIVG